MDNQASPVASAGEDVCAPNAKYEGASCIPLDVLESMVDEYNNAHPDVIIDLKSIKPLKQINLLSYKTALVKLLRHKLKKYSENQADWVKLPFFKNMKNKEHLETLSKYTFKPSGPKNSNEWLNTLHINEIFAQYEIVYKDFKFFGAIPRDFDKLPSLGIKDLDFEELVKDGITKIGFIFNLDTHNMPGSHWVALYANLKNGEIDYIDSVGDKPCHEFMSLMKRIFTYCKSQNISSTQININETQHQKGNSECGVYSCSFILRLLKGESFEDITATPVSDTTIKKCRFKYFK